MVPFPPWAFSVILSMMLATVAIVFAIKKKIFSRRESSKQRADPAVVDDMITPAEIDYSELQRNLDKGVHALDNVRENVQTLFFGVHGAQVLHSEVENCVSALAEELDLTSSSEATVSELEKLLENETRNRWALRIAHEKELKSVNAKLATLETALLVAREQYEQNLADQEKAFDVILREKNDEIGILDATSSEQKRLLSDLQMTSEQMKLDLASLKDASIECDKLAESVSLSAKSQEDLKRQLEMAQAEFNMKTEEYVKLSSELANVKDSLLLTESTIERLKSEKEYILSESNGIQEKSNLLQAELDSLKNELVDKEKVSVDLELKLAENAALQSQLDEALTRTHQLKIELSISSDERSKLLDQLTELRSLRNEASDISPSDLCNLRLDYENLNNENKTLQDAIERLRYELKTKVDDLAHKDSALHEALSQAEQYRSEQKKLTDTQLEISVIEAEERIRELQLEHDQDICQLKQEHLDAIGKLNLDHQNVLQKLLETHREEAAGLKLEVLEANQTIGQLQENIVQLNSDLNLLQESVTSSEKNHVEQRLELEQHISSLKAEIVQMECNWTDEKVALEKAFSERVCSENRSLQSKVQKLQQENCILSNALLEETSKQKSVLDELEQSRRLSDVLKSQYESLRQEEERETISRIDIALQQKSFEFETSINELVQNYENQIAELNEKLDSLSSLDQDAQERERAFTETLQESLAAVNRSKDSEIASIHQDYLKKLATKDAASDAARLDFQSKLEAANKSLDQQAKSFENRLKAELEAQTLCSSKRLEFAENTISKLQDELQACRTVINNLNAEVKISKFKADGAGVLLDRVHSYKTQLACSDQKKSELLQLLNNRDKDLQRLNAKVRDQEIVISHFENAIQEYEIEFKNHVETINLLHSTYTSKLLNLEACIDRMEEQRLGSSSSNEQKLREEIDQLKLSVDQHQMDFRAFLEDFEQSSLKTIYDSFKEEKASILASKDELTKALVEKSAKLEELQAAMDSKGKEITALKSEFDDKLAHLQRQTDLERQSYAKDALESLKKQHKLELKELEAANQSDLALMEKARAEERQIYAKQLNEALESLKKQHKLELQELEATNQSEQLLLNEKARTEERQSYAKELNEALESLKKQHKLELQELEATNQSEQLLLIEKVRTEERQSYAKELNEALESLKKQHKLELQELEAANQSEQLVSIEKARTEAAAEWQSLRDKTEATWKEKLRIAVETARSTNATAILNAIECERRSSERRYQTELKEQAELFEKRRADIDSAWQCKLDEASCAIESLQTRLDQLDRFHKPKSRAPLGERDPLTGSRPGSSSNGSVSKKSKGVSKENAPTNQEVHQPGPGSETTKSVSSRGSRSRSRRDSFGYRYWKASDFHLRSELGQGTYGTHYLAIEHKTSTQYAINRISRRKVEKTNSADTLIRRIELMGQLTHPYLRRMLGSFEDDRWIYIVQEYIPNSKPLSVHLQDLVRKKYVFPPSDVAFLVSCLANVLDYIHGKGIVHCQVSVDKVLLTSNGVPKLSGPTVGLNNLPVLPPEHLSADDSAPSLSWAVDSWSLGVLSFTLLVGRVPFTVEDNVIDVNKVANEEPVFSSHSDPLAKSLIENLLCKDPSQRLRMSQVLQHPFILHYQKKEPLTTIREDQRL